MNAAGPRSILLLVAPISDVTQAYTAVPALQAVLREHGYPVSARDLSLELLEHSLRPEFIATSYAQAVSAAESRLRGDAAYAQKLAGLRVVADEVVRSIEKAVLLLRKQRIIDDVRAYRRAVRILHLAFDIVSLPSYPGSFGPCRYETGRAGQWAALLRSTADQETNPLLAFLRDSVVPSVLASDPLLVGISVTYEFQLVPGLALARLLKAAGLYVVVGGAVIQRLRGFLMQHADAFDFADCFVIGEGETAALRIAEALKNGTKPTQVPNSVMLNATTGEVEQGPLHIEDVKRLPIPDFDGMPLGNYLSPEPVLLVSTTRGCYYGQCAFCDVSTSTGRSCRMTSRGRLAETVRTLRNKYGARRFFFCDDAMPPSHMSLIADLVVKELPDVTWQAEARFESVLTESFLAKISAGGCRQLIFGLESRSARVLKLMNKKNCPTLDDQIIRSCRKVGIAVNAQTFIGFPGEMQDEARLTIDYLLGAGDRVASIGFTTFSLYPGTPVFLNPANYGVSGIEQRPEPLASLGYETSRGMRKEDAEAMHAEALHALGSVYGSRSFMLGGPWGAHGLLLLTDASLDGAYRIWSEQPEAGSDCGGAIANVGERVLRRSDECSVVEADDGNDGAPHLLFCRASGQVFALNDEELRLLQSFDECTDTFAVALAHAREFGDPQEELARAARALALAGEFLRAGILREV